MESSWRGYATVCRLCLQRDGFMLGIFNRVRGGGRTIHRKIVDCTALEISFGDGLPSSICHRCLYKIEFCLDFRQQCFVSDATLRQISTLPIAAEPSDDVVMVIDPNALDYDSEYDSDQNASCDETNADNADAQDFADYQDLSEFRNVFLCKYCDRAFTEKADCSSHEATEHDSTVPYSCSDCDMTFLDRINYSAHLKSVHQNDKPYNCPECERTFTRRSDLRKHTVVHTGIKPFTCNVCFKSFSRNTNLSKHMRIHSGQKPFVCPKCPKTFISKGDLTRHTIIHSGQKPYSCNYCNLSFGRRDKLLRHEKKHYPIQDSEEHSNQDLLEKPEWPSSENMIIDLDPFSHEEYNQESKLTDLEEAVGAVEPRLEPEAGEVELGGLLDERFAAPDGYGSGGDGFGRELPCVPEHITGDSFTDNPASSLDGSSALNSAHPHQRAAGPVGGPAHLQQQQQQRHHHHPHHLHHGFPSAAPPPPPKRHPCFACRRRFPTLEALRGHALAHHHPLGAGLSAGLSSGVGGVGDRPHRCHVCAKSFMRKRELDRHVATHTGMKPFKCSSCDKRFGRKDKLIRHTRIHDVNREHACAVCGATFNRKDGLTHHMKTHVKDEGGGAGEGGGAVAAGLMV